MRAATRELSEVFADSTSVPLTRQHFGAKW